MKTANKSIPTLLAFVLCFTITTTLLVSCDNEPLEGEFVVDDGVDPTDDTTGGTDDTTGGTDDTTDDTTGGDIVITGPYVSQEFADATTNITYTYSSDGLLTNWAFVLPIASGSLDLVYNASDQLTQVNRVLEGIGSSTSYSYNADGSLSGYDDITITYDGTMATLTGTINGNPGTTVTLQLNATGRVIRSTEPDGGYGLYSYDGAGNLTTLSKFDAADNPEFEYTVTYDSNLNPFNKQLQGIYIERFMEFFYEFDSFLVDGFEGYSFPYFANNVTGVSLNGVTEVSYTYNYNTDGYPTDITRTDDTDSNSWTYIYE